MQVRFTLVVLLGCVSLTTPAWAFHDNTLKVVPGQTTCQSQDINVGSKAAKGRLCVTQGKFSHDKYAFDIDGQPVLSGIDDETNNGITGSYNGQSISLVCKPELKKPTEDDPMVAGMAKSLMSKPGVSEQQARQMASAMLTVEVGRQCLVEQDKQTLMDVSIHFD